jgi:hypothetical protein
MDGWSCEPRGFRRAGCWTNVGDVAVDTSAGRSTDSGLEKIAVKYEAAQKAGDDRWQMNPEARRDGLSKSEIAKHLNIEPTSV